MKAAGVVLVAEDNPITRKMLRVTLEIEGFSVLDAGAAAEALERVAAQRPDFVVVDYVLPDLDGLTLLEEVRRRAGPPEIPAVVITGMVSRLEELRARAGPSTHVLSKPVAPSELIELMRAHLAPVSRRDAGLRILVVDDEPLNLKLAEFRLRRAGFEVETAQGGPQALERARRRRPDAILSDVMMPVMDGFTFCREVRRIPELAAVPVVLLSSAYVDAADADLARQMGANALVVRSPDLAEALAALERSVAAPGRPEAGPRTDVTALHRERLQVQLDRQAARNEALLRQAAIQATALSIVRGLSEVLSQPRNVTDVLADVLVHCLDAAGLSTGLLYVTDTSGAYHLQAQFGVDADRRPDAELCFGHPDLLRRIAASGEPAALSSAAEAPPPDERDFLFRVGTPSAVVMPFVVMGEVFGVLLLASDNHDLSEESWISFARNLAVQFGQTVALGQSLKRLAASESRYRTLMEEANDAIYVVNPHGVIVGANRRGAALAGMTRDEVVGRHISSFGPPEAAAEPDYLAPFGRTLTAGSGSGEGIVLQRPDGSRVEVDFSMSRTETDGDVAVLAIGRDVTERNRAGRELAERMEMAAFAADTGAALVRDQPLGTMLQQCAEAMVGHLQAAFARIWTLNEAGDVLELRASAGQYTHLDGPHGRVAVGAHKIGRIAAERVPHLTNDIQNDPWISDRAWAAREGMVAFAGYPLVVGDHLVGVMAMFGRQPLSATVLDAMAAVANQIALGIEGKRAEDALRKAQQRLDHVVFHGPAVLYSLRPAGGTFELTWISANVERLLGYPARECLASDWWTSRLHADDRDRVLAEIGGLPASGRVEHEYRFLHRDGGYRWVRAEIRLLRNASGEGVEAVGSWSDVGARKAAEIQLQESEEKYRLLFDSNPFPMSVVDRKTIEFLAVNEASVRVYGFSRDEFLSMTVSQIRAPDTAALTAEDYLESSDAWGTGGRPLLLRRHRKKDGTEIEVEVARSPITFEGRPAWLALISDVTQKKTLEAQLVRAQKMEAVGQLAGGIAHDFNNLLGVITGYSELLLRELSPTSRPAKRAEEILRAADRAAALTRQLLAFGRRQLLQPRLLDVNEVVADVEKMMRRLISEDIQITTIPGHGLGMVRADAGQLEQVLLNLAINARDAMPAGGRLLVETANADLDDSYVRLNPEAQAGRFVMLSVSDTGHGMDRKTMSRIFEPFFTTKEEGKGTGLGLATVYGIVRQSGGTVNVYSEPGQGTTFKIYLPRVDGPAAPAAPAARAEAPGGSETLLLVEDAEPLRLLIRELLENAGYVVVDADAPDKALSLVEAMPGAIDVVLTDMVMPRMSGQDFAGRLRVLKPEARIVFMSGYSDRAIGDQALEPGALFLQKPFTMDALMRIIREALDTPRNDG
jgi:two-component system, cell cycle sensor histidine kinase and response regulator CckA